jgi:hypothetical protein
VGNFAARNEIKIDLPRVEFSANGKPSGVILSSSPAQVWTRGRLNWWTGGTRKNRAAGLRRRRTESVARNETANCCARGRKNFTGELVLIGNGKFYGGPFQIFPQADLRDGLLDVCILPRVDWPALIRAFRIFSFAAEDCRKKLSGAFAGKFELSGETKAAFELDGEWAGSLPATFSIERERLRVIVP